MEPITKKPIHNHPPLQRMRIKMYGRVYTLDPEQDLAVTKSSVGEAAQTQPAVYAFYATVRDMAEGKVNAVETKMVQMEADLDQEYRKAGQLPNGVKLTEDGIKKAIRSNPEYQTLQNALVETTVAFKQLGSIVRAFEQRLESIKIIAKRADNTTWNDRDVTVEIAADVQIEERVSAAERNVGKHPSRVN